MLFIFSLISTILHANYQGNSSQCNNINDPCSYETVERQMSFGDAILFSDRSISDPFHLESFHNLSVAAFRTGVSLKGTNTVINGNQSKYYFPAFIIIEDKHNVSLESFIFTGFSFPIIYCKNNSDVLISYCDFTNNHVDNKIAILIFENSISISFISTNFSILTSHDASILSSSFSNIKFDRCSFDKAFLFHASKDIPLIMSIKSNFKIFNSIVIQNQSPYSPFFLFNESSSLLIENSSFSSNQNNIIFYCQEVKRIMIKNSFFYNNMGNFITNNKLSVELNIYKTHFEQNYSPVNPFFNIINSTVKFNDHCSFISNSAQSALFNIVGSQSLVAFNETLFFDNQLDDSLIKCIDKSKLVVYSCKFNNSQSKRSVIMGTNSKLIITKTHFHKSWSPSIFTTFCNVQVKNSIFDQSKSQGKLSISSLNSTKVQIFDSFFNDKSLSFLINLNGNVSLKNLKFKSNKEYALSKKMSKICQNCSYLEEIITDNDFVFDASSLIMIVISLIIFVLILIIFRKRLSYCWRRLRNPKFID